MKKYFFIYLQFISLTLLAQTNIYHPIPDTGIVWREFSYAHSNNCCCGGFACINEENYNYFIDGDITIGSITYKKLYKTGSGRDYVPGPPTCPPGCSNYDYYYMNNIYIGGLYQDTTQRKVFFIPTGQSNHTLLYDFNLSVRDTLPPSYNNVANTNIVSMIDSISIGSNYHKRYWLSYQGTYTNYVSIIEGIGSEYGLLYAIVPIFESATELICVNVNSVTVYPDTLSICNLASSVIENNDAIDFSIYPNPFSNQATIIINPKFIISELKIYDGLGKLVRTEDHNSSEVILKKGNLNQGLYIFELTTSDEKKLSRKFTIE